MKLPKNQKQLKKHNWRMVYITFNSMIKIMRKRKMKSMPIEYLMVSRRKALERLRSIK